MNVVKTRKRPVASITVLFASLILVLSSLVGCGPSTADLAAVDYAPL
jgi:hypothetical protein